MATQTAVSLSTQMGYKNGLQISAKDREILRGLAFQVAELAAEPAENEKRKLWYRHNSLEETRPVIFCDPENGWDEIVTQEQLLCKGELARDWEMRLRKEIFWGRSMGDDRVVEPFFNINCIYDESDYGVHETVIGGGQGKAYRWEAPIKDYGCMSLLRFPEISVDYEKTYALLQLAGETLGDILHVKAKNIWWWTLGMTWTLIKLRGLEQMMYDMYDYPEELHRLMAFLRDEHLARLDFLEKKGLLSLNNDGTYVGSGGFGYTTELPRQNSEGAVKTTDMWGFAESQETTQVSPAMFKEFIFPYQLPILERFGLNCYGCCEPINKRWESVKQIPRLRRVSVSPWADIHAMAEYLGNRYIFSYKPNPAYLATPRIDEEYIRRSLREALKITAGCRVEIIMKDNNTICNNPENVIHWCKIAREEAENAAL